MPEEPIDDATALAARVRSGEVTPRELVDQAIARIDQLNPSINAVIHERFDRARAEADGPLPDGPFAGVPFLVKDLQSAIAGEPHHMGNAGLKNRGIVAPHDSYLYQRFRSAGLVTLGRTNTPEFGLTITTEPAAYGPTRNPWGLDHSVGGSSGGSAAAVAAGIVPVAHANDGGGSIRIPASECGLVGLKPSRGRVSQGPDVGEAWAGATIDGVVSRTVRDTATMLDAISGPEPGDPYYVPPPGRPFADEVGADPGRLRIGLMAELPDATVHPECVAAVESTGRLLESLGHDVTVAMPEAFQDPEMAAHFLTIIGASTAADFATIGDVAGGPLTEDEVEADNWIMAQIGQSISAPDYIRAVVWMHQWTRRMASWWADDGFDVLVSPVIATPPPAIGWLGDPATRGERVVEMLLYTAQFNTTGQPAVSLPLHWTPEGLPVGVQFAGAYAREDLLIRLATQIEAAQPWADRHPPLFARS